MVVPDSVSVSRELQLSVVFIYAVVIFVAVLLVTSIFLVAEYFGNRVSEDQLSSLQAENRQLMQKYEKIRWDLAESNERFQDLVQKEIRIRTMFDLPEISTEERRLGIGGPLSPVLSSMNEAERTAYSTEMEVDRLLRLSRYELEKFEEVEKELQTFRDRLDHTPSIRPTRGWDKRGFGMKDDPFTGYRRLHRGLDIANNVGTPVIATADGVVRSTGKVGRLGNMIAIDHGYGFVTRYGHLSKFAVKPGQKVSRGDILGYMGSTGYSTGPHVHYETWRNGKALNPNDFILDRM